LPTLTDGFAKLSGKVGTLIIINPSQETIVLMPRSAVVTAASNITVKPLFIENKYIIDCRKYKLTGGVKGIFDVRGSLKIISAIFKKDYHLPFYYFLDYNVDLIFIQKTLTLEKVDIVNLDAAFGFTVEGTLYFNEGTFNGSDIYFFIDTSGQVSFKNMKFLNFREIFISVLSKFVMEDCYFSEGTFPHGIVLFSQSQTNLSRGCTELAHHEFNIQKSNACRSKCAK